MRYHFGILTSIFLFIFVVSLRNVLAELPNLEERVNQEIQNPYSHFPDELKQILKKKHIVFVDGVMNELASMVGNYFSDNIKEVKRLRLTYSHTRFSSSKSIPFNADKLYEEIQSIYRKVQKPIILFGHSMGGAESLYLILKYPELLILNIIDRVVLVEPAVGGSPLAENFTDCSSCIFTGCLGDGINSLCPEQAHRNFSEVFQNFKMNITTKFESFGMARVHQEIENISKKVFFFTSAHPEDEPLSFGLRIVRWFCKNGVMEQEREKLLIEKAMEIEAANGREIDEKGVFLPAPETLNHPVYLVEKKRLENDGLLFVKDQTLPQEMNFGRIFHLPKKDHIECVVSGCASHSNKVIRGAFTRTTLEVIHEVH